MGQKGRIHSSGFKAKVALAVLRGEQTIADICQTYQVHSSLVHKWKRQLLEQLPSVFEDHRSAKKEGCEQEIQQLHQKIEELMVERDFLKKALGRLGEVRGKK